MIRAFIFAVLAFSVGEVRADWRTEAAALQPGPYPPPPDNLRARYVFGWGGFEAAAADVRLERGTGRTWNAAVRGGTTGVVRKLWKLDADYDAEVSEDGWRSIQFTLIEKYKRYRVTETTEFRPGGVRSRRVNSKDEGSEPKWLNFYVGGLRDMAGALLLARSQPLATGDTLKLAVFPGEWMYLVRLKVIGRETLRWRGEQRKVIRCAMDIDWIGKDYSLQPHKKFQRGTVWVSDDEVRLPLRVEVKVFIGHVFAELAEVKAAL